MRRRRGGPPVRRALTVMRTKVVSEILARWPDVIGRPIDPFTAATA